MVYIIPYDGLPDISNVPDLNGIFCYFLEYIEQVGFSVVIIIEDNGGSSIRFGEFDGKKIDLADTDKYDYIMFYLINYHPKVYSFMTVANIKQIQLFICIKDNKLILTDVQTSLNKMVGPGMLRDVFGKLMPTPEVIKISHLNDELLASIGKTVMIKPSRFRLAKADIIRPLYAIAKSR